MGVNKNKDSLRISKRMYIESRQALLQLPGLSEQYLNTLVLKDNSDEALKILLDNLSSGTNKETLFTMAQYGVQKIGDLFDNVYYYKKMLHLELEKEPVIKDKLDLSYLREINRDITIDFKHNDTMYSIFVYHRNYPIQNEMKSKSLDWTIYVYTDQSFGIDDVTGYKNILPMYAIHLTPTEDVYKVFIDLSPCSDSEVIGCRFCNKCNNAKLNSYYGTAQITSKIHTVFKKNECSGLVLKPIVVLSAVQYVIELYSKREVVMKSKHSITRQYKSNKVHVIRTESDTDTEIKLPLHLYVKQYNPSVKREYKGGHHKSPAAHYREGYFRRSKSTGDYIIDGDRFVKVEKGSGTHIYVQGCYINQTKGSDIIYKV